MTGTTVEAGDNPPAGTDSQGKVELSTLPTVVQEYIKGLRKEAEGNRTAKEAAEAKVKELEDEVETAQTASRTMSENAQKATRALLIRDLRETYGLDQKAEKFLTAESEEELKDQAEALSAFATPVEKNDTGDTPPEGTTSVGMVRATDPAQTAESKVDPDQERVDAFFGGLA